MSEAREELERAAAAHRGAKDPEKPRLTDATARRRQLAMRNAALADDDDTVEQWISISFAIAGLFGPAFFFMWRFQAFRREWWMYPAAILLAGLGFLGAMEISSRVTAMLRLSALRGAGHGFNIDEYLDSLGCRRFTSQLLVRITLSEKIAAEDGRKAADAAMTWEPDLKARWSPDYDDKLVFDSGELSTTMTIRQGGVGVSGKRVFDNQPLHRQMRAILRVVPRLHAVYPVANIRAEIVGKVTAFDEDLGPGWL